MSRITLGALAAAVASLTIASAQAETIYGLVANGTAGSGLVTFDSSNPSAFSPTLPITGVTGNLRAIDFRPATGELYGLTYDANATTQLASLYKIDINTGGATQVGSSFVLTGAGASTRISIDFNPTVDRIRVVSGSTLGNYRLHPDTAALTVDTSLAFDASDVNTGLTSLVAGIAYTNNVIGATSTALYAYEFTRDQILTIGTTGVSPNTGRMFTIGGLGGPSAFDGGVGMDISGVTGIAYLSMDEFNSPTAFEEIYTINLATGAATLIGDEIGINLLDISVAPAPIPEPAALGLLPIAGLALARRRR